MIIFAGNTLMNWRLFLIEKEDETICFCASISLIEILNACKTDDLMELYALGMTQYCGSCREEVEEIIEKNLFLEK